jgi:hypothetical protein
MFTTRRPPAEEKTTVNISLFLITLPKISEPHEIFELTSRYHIAIRGEAYKAQTYLTQCYNCQKFGNISPNCKQPPRFMLCGGGHLHRECPQTGSAASIPTCCSCKLMDGEESHPSKYLGCRHAKEEMWKRKSWERPRLQRAALPQDCPSRRCYATVHSNSSSLILICTGQHSLPWDTTNKYQVSSG